MVKPFIDYSFLSFLFLFDHDMGFSFKLFLTPVTGRSGRSLIDFFDKINLVRFSLSFCLYSVVLLCSRGTIVSAQETNLLGLAMVIVLSLPPS